MDEFDNWAFMKFQIVKWSFFSLNEQFWVKKSQLKLYQIGKALVNTSLHIHLVLLYKIRQVEEKLAPLWSSAKQKFDLNLKWDHSRQFISPKPKI